MRFRMALVDKHPDSVYDSQTAVTVPLATNGFEQMQDA